MNLPTLYKKDSKGNLQYWRVVVLENTEHSSAWNIHTFYGKVGGKEQATVDLILEGKNIGKANETTSKEQAELEAQAKWTKQKDRKGYVENPEDCDKDDRPGAEPMLAHRYDKFPEKIKFPALAQPKLDGHRCIAIVDNGTAKLYSRQRKPITGLPHIEQALVQLVPPGKKMILDGELYNHAYKHRFEELTSFIRSEQPKPGSENVEYHVYDLVEPIAYYDRYSKIQTLLKEPSYGPIVKVATVFVDNEDQALSLFNIFRKEGYEGLMLRNTTGVYEGTRSYDLQKVKEFQDDEFEIVGITEGRGKMKGHAIFECITKEGNKFNTKMKGSMDKLAEYFNNADKYIGKIITVRFMGYTEKNNVPRHGVAVRFREDV